MSLYNKYYYLGSPPFNKLTQMNAPHVTLYFTASREGACTCLNRPFSKMAAENSNTLKLAKIKKCIQPLFTLGSVYSTSASGAEQTIERNNSNITYQYNKYNKLSNIT